MNLPRRLVPKLARISGNGPVFVFVTQMHKRLRRKRDCRVRAFERAATDVASPGIDDEMQP